MTRAKNLTPAAIEKIIAILDGWSEKLSWDLLIEAITRHTRVTYTRQALSNHERIKDAFTLRKTAIAQKGGATGAKPAANPVEQVAMDRIARLEGENARLRMENDRLLEKFSIWAYNAHGRGLDEGFLSQPLPIVNRERTQRVV